MHPILFELGGLPIPSYGAALSIAFAIGILPAKLRADRYGLDGEYMLELGIVLLVTSLLGSRLLWAATHVEAFQAPHGTWSDLFNPFHSSGRLGVAGLSMMGGVALAAICSLGYLHLRRLPVLRYADVAAPSIALGGGITRIGCFLNGCCFGTSCDLPWAVRFPAHSPAAAVFGDILVHPAQLYATIGSFLLFGALIWLGSRERRDGVVFWTLLAASGSGRILLDLFRHYEPQEIVLRIAATGISVSQTISAGLLAAGLIGLARVYRQPPAAS